MPVMDLAQDVAHEMGPAALPLGAGPLRGRCLLDAQMAVGNDPALYAPLPQFSDDFRPGILALRLGQAPRENLAATQSMVGCAARVQYCDANQGLRMARNPDQALDRPPIVRPLSWRRTSWHARNRGLGRGEALAFNAHVLHSDAIGTTTIWCRQFSILKAEHGRDDRTIGNGGRG